MKLTIDEIGALLTAANLEMFYVQATKTGKWWASIDSAHNTARRHLKNIYTQTEPFHTEHEGRTNNYTGIYNTKDEAIIATWNEYIGETE